MPRFVDPETGERFENDAPDAAEQASSNDLVLESDYEYDQKPFLGKAAETIRATGDAASRMMNPVNKLLLGDDVPDVATSQADREIAQRHPYAGMVGQAVMAAPLLPLGGLPALAAESALGGTVTEAENAWLEDRDFSKESAFMNVGANLLVGGALWGGALGAQSLTRYGRNLLTEAENAAGARAARELTERVTAKEGSKALSAADIAAMDPSDHAVAYLRDNADELMDELATKQAKAAQDLLDSYGQVSKLKTPKKELAELIPEANKLDQSRWVVSARQQAYDLLETVPDGVGRPLQERLAKLDEGASPVAWFQRAGDVSDELMSIRARAAADPAVQASLDTLDRVQQIFSDGLGNPSIWGKAAERETQRASGYARRLQEHLADFESQFTSKVGKRNLADPSKFRDHLRADSVDGALRQRAVDATLDAARATAEQSQKFGKPEQAKKILDAVQALDDLQRQGGALKAAQRSAVVEPKADRSAGALAWLGNQAKQRAGSAIGGVAGSMVGGGPIGGLVGAGVGEAAQRGIESLAARISKGGGSAAAQGIRSKLAARAKQSGYVVLGKRAAAPAEGVAGRVSALPELAADELPKAKNGSLFQLKQDAQRARKGLSVEEGKALKDYTSDNYGNMRDVENGGAGPAGRSVAEIRDEIDKVSFAYKDATDAEYEALTARAKQLDREMDAAKARQDVEHLRNAHDKTSVLEPTKHGPLYRGLSDLPDEAIAELLNEDQYITAATTSTSYNPDIAKSFSTGKNPVVFKIDRAEHGSIAPLADGYEQEVLLPAGQKFQIEKRERLDTGQLLVTVKQTGHATPKDMADLGALGFAETGAEGGLRGIASSPLGVITGAGAAGLGAYKAYQMALDDQDPAAERAGVFRAVGAFRRNADEAGKRGADDLLRTQPQGAQAQGARNGVSIAAPTGPGPVNALNYDAVRGHIDKMANDPRYFAEVMGASFGRLPEVAPEVYSALSAQAARAANYLSAVAPGGESGGPFSDVVPVSDDELWDFNQRLSAISDPDFVRDELRQGSLTSQAIEAYQAVHERSYVKLQIHVFERLQQLKADGIPVPSQAREQLDVLLDIDGGGDPALTWQVAERAAAAEQAHKSRLAMKPKAPGDSGAMTSGALASLQNGAAAVAQTG